MVSLSRSFNTNSAGATFFSESVNMEEREHLQPILDSYGVFKPIKTIPIFSFHLMFTFVLNIIAIVYSVLHPDEKSKCREYFIIIYIHIALWFLTIFLHFVAKHYHHQLRMNGYLEFYKKTECSISLPLLVVSLWSISLMFVQTLMQHYYPDDFAEKCLKNDGMSPIHYLCGLITVEFFAIARININYMVDVARFNKEKPPPDVQRNDWAAVSSPDTLHQNEVGYRELGDKVQDLLEKQADLIRYLKEHNNRLSEKVMVLSAQLQQARGARAST
ncbi:transmembrane protein 192 [Cylas formicarius]|uniref:transmembrane protein 192 n=1 Tax=Cylas formicarius TaxID=197179 RepID=UPI002958D31F|nr:transmembrane protein 192 [Cylas formicarius]